MTGRQVAATGSETDVTDADPVASDPEVARQLSNIHRTLELIALLLAVLLAGSGGIGTIAGGCAVVLLVGNAITRAIGG